MSGTTFGGRRSGSAPDERDTVHLVAAEDPTPDWPLVGREDELAAISQALGGTPGSAVISGPAGVGKTRLAREAVRVAAGQRRPTRWVAGTRATPGIPLGALAHLLGPGPASADRLSLFQHATSALSDIEPHPVVLAVDDAHLLDETSATLVHQLAMIGSVAAVLTVRSDEPPTHLAALWKDGLATRVDLRDLSGRDTAELVAATLGGDVEARTVEGLWHLSQGNPRFLRELVDGERRAGRLHLRDGLWWWDGELDPSPALVEIVLDRLGPADPDQRAVLEVLAAAEPLSLTHLRHFCPQDSIAALERRGVVSVDRGLVRLAHPLYGPVMRAHTALRGILGSPSGR